MKNSESKKTLTSIYHFKIDFLIKVVSNRIFSHLFNKLFTHMYKVFKAFQQFKNIEEINKNLLIKFKINQWHFYVKFIHFIHRCWFSMEIRFWCYTNWIRNATFFWHRLTNISCPCQDFQLIHYSSQLTAGLFNHYPLFVSNC